MTDKNGNQGSATATRFAVGATVEAGERTLRVSKLGPSPLPGDRRLCAYTQLA